MIRRPKVHRHVLHPVSAYGRARRYPYLRGEEDGAVDGAAHPASHDALARAAEVPAVTWARSSPIVQ